ncbi:30S ribosomal protein S17 [Patescibacteria group bacterium]|nr:30S ribosomal protein S17 [Patescibacteria group bacterium]
MILVKTNKIKRSLEGLVVSAKTDKTRVVKVERVVVHPKYGKRIRLSQRYHAHDEKNEYKLGDKVILEATRPLSRLKRWRIVGKLK